MTTSTHLDEVIGRAAILLVLAVMLVLLFGDLMVEYLDLLVGTAVVVAAVMVVLYVGGRRLE